MVWWIVTSIPMTVFLISLTSVSRPLSIRHSEPARNPCAKHSAAQPTLVGGDDWSDFVGCASRGIQRGRPFADPSLTLRVTVVRMLATGHDTVDTLPSVPPPALDSRVNGKSASISAPAAPDSLLDVCRPTARAWRHNPRRRSPSARASPSPGTRGCLACRGER